MRTRNSPTAGDPPLLLDSTRQIAPGEEISLTWFDIGEPLLIHSQPNQIPDRRYGVCTVLIPSLGTRLVRNGVEGQWVDLWPREREGTAILDIGIGVLGKLDRSGLRPSC